MNTSLSALEKFRDKWCHPESAPDPVTIAELERIGFKLGFVFPASYVNQLVSTGAVNTTLGLLSVIVDLQADLHPLSKLNNPAEILEHTEGWRAAGMPATLIAIGYDPGGSSFCFDMQERPVPRRREPAIYFWDHDFDETTKVASSFTNWIESYLQLSGDFDSWKDEEDE